mgnify:CR=1 FL=1
MATRCSITIKSVDGQVYRIYRHNDGAPEAVLSDLRILTQVYDRNPVEDPEYFLANFIFYAKLRFWKLYSSNDDLPFKPWELGYGVCQPKCEHFDLAYRYLIYKLDNKVRIKIEEREGDDYKIIFDGDIRKAFEKWAKEEGCHIPWSLFTGGENG